MKEYDAMLTRLNRLSGAILLTVVLCTGILLGSVFSVRPIQVQGQDVPDEETVILQRLYQQVNPSVVNIRVTVPAGAAAAGLLPVDPFAVPGTPDAAPGAPTPPAPGGLTIAGGSGFVYDNDGHIVTNAHGVQDASKIQVTLSDNTTLLANVLGIDLDSDIAVIKVDTSKIKLPPPLTLGDSEKLMIGERAVAIGNPFGQKGTMTQGIISGLGRSLEGQRSTGADGGRYLIPQVIQTDAPINPGNSGGPLLNGKGEVIGVNTAIESRLGQSSGVGFAVPSSIVKRAADALVKTGKVAHSYLGIAGGTLTMDLNQLMGLDDNFHGVLIQDAAPDGPAGKAGIKGSTTEKQLEGSP